MPDFPPAPPIASSDKDDIATRTWTRDIATVSSPTGSYGKHVERVLSQIDAPTEGSLLMNGTEQNLLLDEPTTPPGESWQEGFIDLTPMTSGDTIVIREYMSIVTPVSYKKYAEETYSGAQAIPLLHTVTRPYRYGIKVTAQQTAGTMRTLYYQFFKRKRST